MHIVSAVWRGVAAPAGLEALCEGALYLCFGGNGQPKRPADLPRLRGIEGILKLMGVIHRADLVHPSNSVASYGHDL